ncbi:MAG: YncE family protein [Pyrinomonadaceae bacterium]
MADNYLLVPLQLDAMVLNPTAATATPFLRFQMDYTQLQSFNSPEPRPFGGAPDKQPDPGIYLHWTLPKALRHGMHKADEGTDFPLVPNRWLIVRVKNGAPADQAVKAWILESDHVSPPGPDATGTSPFVDPNTLSSSGTPQPTVIGRALRLVPSLKNLETQASPFLKALGPGSAYFSVFSPGVDNVFSFHDDLKENDDTTPITATQEFTYHVAGWYSDPTHDPINHPDLEWVLQQPEPNAPGPDVPTYQLQWQANTDPTVTQFVFDWLVYAGSANLPKRMLVHALVSTVVWSLAENPPAPTYPIEIQKNVKVAIGNTAIDALSAIVRLDRNSQTEADLLEAFQYNLLEQFDQPGNTEALNMAIRQHWYGASPGGTRWTIVAKERAASTATPAPVVTEAQQDALACLNAAQYELDRQQRLLESMQWDLFSLWWKNSWQAVNGLPFYDPQGEISNWFSAQLPLHLGTGSTCNNATGMDPAQESWLICKVKAQQNLVTDRTAKTQAAQTTLPGLINANTQELKALNMPQYYSANDPVILVTGLGRATNFDPVDGLMCRLPSQTVSDLTVSGATYSASASGSLNIQSHVPVLSDPNGLLPDAVQALQLESFFLSPRLFAQDVLGDTVPVGNADPQADAVRQALQSLPTPAAENCFAPVAFAWSEWIQPWIPLLLDWEITVLKEPAYSSPANENNPPPACTFNQQNWQFNGTDYVWNGATTAGGPNHNFDESDSQQMTLTGRTFITPQLSFTLANQLEQYVQKHKLRDPNLENLLEDLETYVQDFKNQDILSQRLSGMMAQLVERSHAQNVAPSGDITQALGDYAHGYPQPFPDLHYNYQPAVWDFAPMAGTFFLINKLTVIDAFGRTINLMLANYSTNPQLQTSQADTYFYPIVGRSLKAPTALDPTPNGLPASSDATPRMIQLPPKPIQDSQLSFRLISNDGHDSDINQVADTNPVCGWIVPNHLDRSLALYAPDGTAWGELYLSLHAQDKYVPVWQPDPTNSSAPQSISDIPNAYVRNMLQELNDRTDDGAAFSGFLQVIDETLWTINPRGARQDQNLSVLIGRPLAIVRAQLSLNLRGRPFYNQDWWNTFNVNFNAPDNLPDASTPAQLGAVDGGVFSYQWPIRLGSNVLRDDGLVGYYLDSPETPASTFSLFNSVNLPANVTSDYFKQIGGNEQSNYVMLRFIDDTVASPDPTRNQVCNLTMLVDPRGSVHAFTGLLPVVTLEVPDQFVTPALNRMAYMFRAGPFLTLPDEVRMPQPAKSKGTWSWFDHVINTTTALSKADGNVRLSLTSPLIKEGWLKFVPDSSDELILQMNKREKPLVDNSNLELKYAFTPKPYPILVSVDGATSVIDLYVMIENPAQAVTINELTIEIPMGAAGGNILSTNANLPSPTFDQGDPTPDTWQITTSGSVVTIKPKAGESGEISTTLTFSLLNITVNNDVGIVPLTISEFYSSSKIINGKDYSLEKHIATFPIKKFFPAQTDSSGNIKELYPPVLYDLDETVLLCWECSDTGKNYTYSIRTISDDPTEVWQPKDCLNSNDCFSCSDGIAGVTSPKLGQTTTFALDVIEPSATGGRQILTTLTITVQVEVPSVSENSYLTQYLSGKIVSLHWKSYKAAKCTIELDGKLLADNVPLDTYDQGYSVFLTNEVGLHQLSVTAHARKGNAKATWNFSAITFTGFHTVPVMESPKQIAMTPDGTLAFLMSNSGPNIMVLDLGTFAVEANTIQVGPQLHSIGVTPDGTLVLANYFTTLTVIDISSRKAEPNAIAVGGHENWMESNATAITSDGKLALVGYGDGSVTIIDIPGRVPRFAIPFGIDTLGIAITPDNSLAFVCNSSGNKVAVIDIVAHQLKTTIPVGSYPWGIATTPDGKLVLVVNDSDNTVTVIDIATLQAEPNPIYVGRGATAIVITSDSEFALVTNQFDNNISVIDIAGRRVVETIPVGGRPMSIAIAADNSLAVVANYSDNTVTVL